MSDRREHDGWDADGQTADDRDVGWGDDPGRDGDEADVERLLADRPPHHDRDER